MMYNNINQVKNHSTPTTDQIVKIKHVIHSSNTTKRDVHVLKKHVLDLSIELLIDHNVKQKELFKYIRNGLHEYVKKLPAQRIMYNNTYGGYGLSKEFIDFCNTIDVNYLDRVTIVPYIIPFAKHILKNHQYNGLFEIMYLHDYYDFDNIFRLIDLYKIKVNSRENLLKNAKIACEYISDDNSVFFDKTKKTSKYSCYYKPSLLLFDTTRLDLKRFTREDIQEFLNTPYTQDLSNSKENTDENVNKYKYVDSGVIKDNDLDNDSDNDLDNDLDNDSDNDSDNDEHQDPSTLASSLFFLDKIIAKYKTKILKLVPENIMDEISEYIDTYQKQSDDYFRSVNCNDRDKERHFIKILNKYGYNSYLTWSIQNKFDNIAISYLSEKQKQNTQLSIDNTIYDFIFKNEYIDIQENIRNYVLENFGLLCASSIHCELDIKEVPGLLDWGIHEYDGKEDIYVV